MISSSAHGVWLQVCSLFVPIMPSKFHRVLLEKLADLPEWKVFRDDFHAATGMTLELVDPLGRPKECGGNPSQGLCARVQECGPGAVLCARFRQGLFHNATQAAATGTCDAGLCEVAVPLKVGGTTAGYLVFGGFRPGPAEAKQWRRARHLLAKAGVAVEEAEVRRHMEQAHEVPERTAAAYIHFIEMAVRAMAERFTLQMASDGEGVPAVVTRACAFIRREALGKDIGLAEVARHCGVSEGHLSRVFHRSTGFAFREYVARFRAGHARELLRNPTRSVTDAAFASGFQSLSQFHRVFRKVYGAPPRHFRGNAAA